MVTSKKYSHCLRVFGKFFVTLHLRCTHIRAYCRHIEDERQTLGYLILKIWTIFKTIQIAGNDAHAGVYIPVLTDCHIYQKRELFYLLLMVGSLEPQYGSRDMKFTLLCEGAIMINFHYI